MLRYTLLALLFCAGASVACPVHRAEQEPRLRVHVYDFVGLPSTTPELAETETARLLRPAIQVTWMNCRIVSNQSCGQEFLAGDIIVRILPHAPATTGADVLGSAMIANQGVYASILYDRVLTMRGYGIPSHSVLGKVMAHEITHLLLGVNSHASRGIMRPRWSVNDFRIGNTPFWFYTPEQQAVMREQLARRTAIVGQ